MVTVGFALLRQDTFPPSRRRTNLAKRDTLVERKSLQDAGTPGIVWRVRTDLEGRGGVGPGSTRAGQKKRKP